MKIYGHRVRVYVALLLFCVSIYFSPTHFLLGVLGNGIAVYFPFSLTLLLTGLFTESFKKLDKQKRVFGIPTPGFCVGMVVIGGGMVATYLVSNTFQLPRLGVLLIFGGIELYLIYHEAKVQNVSHDLTPDGRYHQT